MAYETLPDGRKRWTRAGYMARGEKGLARASLKKGRKLLGTKKPEPGSRQDLEGQLGSLLAKRAKMRDGYRCRP